MALTDAELLRVYRDLHESFPDDVHLARPLIRMLQTRGDHEQAAELALDMARRILAMGGGQNALGFLELCRNLNYSKPEEVSALSSLASLNMDSPAFLEAGDIKVFPLIEQLSDQEALEFFRLAHMKQVPEGEAVVVQGEVKKSFFLILEGKMRVHMDDGTHGRMELGVLGPGQFFGEFACVYDLPRSATVTAATPAVLLEFSDRAISQLMQRSPMAGEALMRTIQIRMIQSLSRSHPAMENLPETDRRWLAEEASILEYRKGDDVERPDDACCVIIHGRLRAVMNRDGNELVSGLEAGDMFGRINPCIRLPSGVRLIADTHCLIARVPARVFHAFMNAYGEFEAWVQRYSIKRIQRWKQAAGAAGVSTVKPAVQE